MDRTTPIQPAQRLHHCSPQQRLREHSTEDDSRPEELEPEAWEAAHMVLVRVAAMKRLQ